MGLPDVFEREPVVLLVDQALVVPHDADEFPLISLAPLGVAIFEAILIAVEPRCEVDEE